MSPFLYFHIDVYYFSSLLKSTSKIRWSYSPKTGVQTQLSQKIKNTNSKYTNSLVQKRNLLLSFFLPFILPSIMYKSSLVSHLSGKILEWLILINLHLSRGLMDGDQTTRYMDHQFSYLGLVWRTLVQDQGDERSTH